MDKLSTVHRPLTPVQRFIEAVIFGSRWLLVPIYLGLVAAQVLYCVKFLETVAGMFREFPDLTETQLMMVVLTLVDAAMVGNLIKTIITGSYRTFIDKRSGPADDQVSSTMLKVKMVASLVGISAIHLLQTFLNPEGLTDRDIVFKITIHVVFVLSTLALAYVDHLHTKTGNGQHTT